MFRVTSLATTELFSFLLEDEENWPKKYPVFKGGDLSSKFLLSAYVSGFYPLYGKMDQEILWWSPDPRMVLFLNNFHLSSRFKRAMPKKGFSYTFNKACKEVIALCAQVSRPKQEKGSTWIFPEIEQAYINLAQLGYVQSVEVWQEEALVGGLYGLALGKIFFGESMFSLVSGASRAGFAHLVETLKILDFMLIDCQQESEYLFSMGAQALRRKEFYLYLDKNKAYL